MLREERQRSILDYVDQQGFVKVEELSQQFNCSEITIRRDINELNARKLIEKLHGGAKSKKEMAYRLDYPISCRSDENKGVKSQIAQLAAAQIADHDHIFLDAGSSVGAVIPFLKNKHVQVYTHGMHHLTNLDYYQIDTYVIGGKLKHITMANVGADTINTIKDCYFDIAVIGANGIDAAFGLSTPDREEAMIKRAIMAHAKATFVLADKSKFEKVSHVSFAKPKGDYTIFTDYQDEGDLFTAFQLVKLRK